MTNDKHERDDQEQHPVLTEEEDAAQRGGDPDPTGEPVSTRPDRVDPEAVKRAREWFGRHKRPSRQDGLWPYLLIRAFPGDTGVRQPPVGYFWESPDIRVYEGEVDDPEGVPPVLHPTVGVPHTVFVHVWNLGRLTALGARVRLWWANPSFSFSANSPEPPHFIGGVTVNLGDRSSADCHALVRIPELWTPVVENGGHECLLAVATHVMDPGGADFVASTDRHVGQRNITLAAPHTDLTWLLDRLGSVLAVGSDLQLLHGGRDVEPILLAHKAHRGREVTLPKLRDVVTPLPDHPTIGHLGTAARTLGGHLVLTGAQSVAAIRQGSSVATIDHDALLPLENLRRPVRISPARAVIEALGVPDLTAGSIAAAVSTSSGDGNLLRFREVRDGVVIGGYSVIVKE
ncbi:MAG: hypothetical protein QOI26_1958 [Pseudonocardiales bacterium]|nr:hypothetical protein [Pseudonocardiales bacterium]